MKDGRTHLAYKAEHAADLDTDRGCWASPEEKTQRGIDRCEGGQQAGTER